jgi:hypothetical protein
VGFFVASCLAGIALNVADGLTSSLPEIALSSVAYVCVLTLYLFSLRFAYGRMVLVLNMAAKAGAWRLETVLQMRQRFTWLSIRIVALTLALQGPMIWLVTRGRVGPNRALSTAYSVLFLPAVYVFACCVGQVFVVTVVVRVAAAELNHRFRSIGHSGGGGGDNGSMLALGQSSMTLSPTPRGASPSLRGASTNSIHPMSTGPSTGRYDAPPPPPPPVPPSGVLGGSTKSVHRVPAAGNSGTIRLDVTIATGHASAAAPESSPGPVIPLLPGVAPGVADGSVTSRDEPTERAVIAARRDSAWARGIAMRADPVTPLSPATDPESATFIGLQALSMSPREPGPGAAAATPAVARSSPESEPTQANARVSLPPVFPTSRPPVFLLEPPAGASSAAGVGMSPQIHRRRGTPTPRDAWMGQLASARPATDCNGDDLELARCLEALSWLRAAAAVASAALSPLLCATLITFISSGLVFLYLYTRRPDGVVLLYSVALFFVPLFLVFRVSSVSSAMSNILLRATQSSNKRLREAINRSAARMALATSLSPAADAMSILGVTITGSTLTRMGSLLVTIIVYVVQSSTRTA